MKKIKSFIALALTGTMLVQPVMASQYTEEEIEKRIEEVGEEYLKFYRDGNSYLYDDNSYKTIGPAGISAGNSGEEAAAQGAGASISGGLFGGLFGFDEIINTAPTYEYSAFGTEEAYEDATEAGAAYDSDADSSVYPSQALTEASEYNMYDSYDFNTEEYKPVKENGFVSVATQPFSTFGADVDTASYSSLRRKLMEPYATGSGYYGIDDSAIRLEEMVNYFNYHYPEATDDKFGVTTTLNPCPWNEDALLLKVGIKAEPVKEESKGSNIVFLIDTSGSMDYFDALPLVKSSMGFLVDKLSDNDIVSIVTYAGSEEVVMEGVSGEDRNRIMSAINSLEPYGGTYGEGGINKAYEIAEKYKIEGGNNRIVLCTDGDFNVGTSSEAGLKELISEKRDTGIFFSCFGFGSGNYSDTTMLTLADNGNGNYFYIDCEKEAEKALDTEFFSTIFTVAKDTKFQVEFNPKTVKGYRLLGYEKRAMAAEDFADDTKDGGEVGADNTVTVLYEIIPSDSKYEIPTVESRYGNEVKEETDEEKTEMDDELLVVNIRYKEPDSDTSVLRTYPVSKTDLKEEMDDDTSWAAGVAQAAMLMRDSEYAGTSSFDEIFNRLKNDPEIMDNDFKAQFLFMLRVMKDYKENKDR